MSDEQVEQTQVEESGADEVAALAAERDAALDRWKRTAADFDNFRKRALREREEYVTLANERLVTSCCRSSTISSARSRPRPSTRRRGSRTASSSCTARSPRCSRGTA